MLTTNLALPTAFQFNVNNTQTISGEFSTLQCKTISVDWGDGGVRSVYSGASQAWSKDYGSAGDRIVKIYNATALTKYDMAEVGANISFDLANLPSGLDTFVCLGSNVVSGDLTNLPSGLTYFACTGSNTITGDLTNLPSGLTYFDCYGSNTISGNLTNLPSGLTSFYCTGSNTISGDLTNLPSGLDTFACAGSNTILGNLTNLPSGLTYFYCAGSNTITGDLANLPSGLTYFYCVGSNTVSDYTTPHTWSTKPTTFNFQPTGVGGLSTAEIDNLLIDFDADLVFASGNVIVLTGTNAARSATSDAAVTNMVSEGATVTTN
jgi:hypothetical protein